MTPRSSQQPSASAQPVPSSSAANPAPVPTTTVMSDLDRLRFGFRVLFVGLQTLVNEARHATSAEALREILGRFEYALVRHPICVRFCSLIPSCFR